jgi:hypothetical protein
MLPRLDTDATTELGLILRLDLARFGHRQIGQYRSNERLSDGNT